MHYLFLAVFAWMLCEGVMLYLLLVKVFTRLPKRLWFFALLGYGEGREGGREGMRGEGEGRE